MNGMTALLADVAAFHRACGVPIGDLPRIDCSRINLRADLIDEEFTELKAALDSNDIEGVADGLADIIYGAVGTAVEFGIPLDLVWAEVHAANMRKVDPATGKVRKREDGKVLKPEGWTPPDIAAALKPEGWTPPDIAAALVPWEVAHLRTETQRLRNVVGKCAARFRHYQNLHLAKGDIGAKAKADANREMAEMCEDALAAGLVSNPLPAEHTRD